MHDVRLIYQKTAAAKYISHLDMNRLVPRVLRRSHLPIWYTQGFNPRVHVVFALPLSLGFESKYDVVDFRITDDDMSNDTVLSELKNALPPDIIPIEVINPTLKPKDVGYAEFFVEISCDDENAEKIKSSLLCDEITVSKTTKKGSVKTFDVKPFMSGLSFDENGGKMTVNVTLTAGNDDNINPMIIFDKIKADGANFNIDSVVRGNILDKSKKLFR